MGLASLILGIISLIMIFIVLVAKISFGAIPSVCAIVGIIFGIMQNKQKKDIKATFGIMLCLIYVVIFIIIAIRGIILMRNMLV